MRLFGFPNWIVVVSVLLSIFFLASFFIPSNTAPSSELPGSLILNVYEPYETATGERIFGVVRYTPSTNAYTLLFSPVASAFPFPIPNFVTSEGEALGIVGAPGSAALAGFSLAEQKVTRVFAELPTTDGFPFEFAVWGKDAVGYSVVERNPFSVETFVSDGKSTTARGEGFPVMFSPSGKEILLSGTNTLSIVSEGGERKMVQGVIERGNGLRTVSKVIPGFNTHFAIILSDGLFSLYRIDWEKASVELVSTLSDVHDAAFAASERAFIIKSGHRVSWFDVPKNTLRSVHMLQTATSSIIGWETDI